MRALLFVAMVLLGAIGFVGWLAWLMRRWARNHGGPGFYVLPLALALLPSMAAAQIDEGVTGGYSPVASRYQWGSTGGDWAVPTGLTVLADCDGDALHSETACRVGDAWTVTGAPTLVASYWRPVGGVLQANAIRLTGGDSVASPALTYGSYCVRGATAAGVVDVACYTGGSGSITLSARDVQRVIVFAEELTAGQIARIQSASFGKLGSLGESQTVTRASSKSCSIGGAWFTVPSGQPCIGDAGLSVEGQRTQYALNNCTTPADQTVTLAAGAHTLWLEGTGTVAAAVGTATATGLPCTATSASACSFTVSVGGTVTLDVTGTVTAMQVENGARSSLICATTTPVTRQADVVSAAHGIASGDRWCVAGMFKADDGWATKNRDLFSIGTVGNNAAWVYASTSGKLVLTLKTATGVSSFTSGLHGFSDGSEHRIVSCVDSLGIGSVYVDGVATPVATGAIGVISTIPAVIHVGRVDGAPSYFDGAVRGFTTCNTSIPEDCR